MSYVVFAVKKRISNGSGRLCANKQDKSLAMLLETVANGLLNVYYAKYLSNICGVGRIATIGNHTEFYAQKVAVNHINRLENKQV